MELAPIPAELLVPCEEVTERPEQTTLAGTFRGWNADREIATACKRKDDALIQAVKTRDEIQGRLR